MYRFHCIHIFLKGYATTYGTEPIWVQYRRNFKGQFAPATRKTCIVYLHCYLYFTFKNNCQKLFYLY